MESQITIDARTWIRSLFENCYHSWWQQDCLRWHVALVERKLQNHWTRLRCKLPVRPSQAPLSSLTWILPFGLLYFTALFKIFTKICRTCRGTHFCNAGRLRWDPVWEGLSSKGVSTGLFLMCSRIWIAKFIRLCLDKRDYHNIVIPYSLWYSEYVSK